MGQSALSSHSNFSSARFVKLRVTSCPSLWRGAEQQAVRRRSVNTRCAHGPGVSRWKKKRCILHLYMYKLMSWSPWETLTGESKFWAPDPGSAGSVRVRVRGPAQGSCGDIITFSALSFKPSRHECWFPPTLKLLWNGMARFKGDTLDEICRSHQSQIPAQGPPLSWSRLDLALQALVSP